MRVLYIYCHPLPESFHAALRAVALDGLRKAGHTVDLLDLYAEKFDPVLSEQERRDYHDLTKNQSGMADYIRRLKTADALVVQFPVWSFGPPAMLKGFWDRIMLPGVAFDISDPAHVKQTLTNLKKIAGVATYGRPRWRAIAIGDPPRRMVMRYLRWFSGFRTPTRYYALYHMNIASEDQRKAFMDRVHAAMSQF